MTEMWPRDDVGEAWPRCEICGLPIDPDRGMAEMYDPKSEHGENESFIVHAECGIERGLIVA